MTTVARRYRFRASHYLPGVAGYDRPHEHDYTIEVAVSGPVDGGMVLDTQALDDLIAPLVGAWDGADLNDLIDLPTTVENLALIVRRRFAGLDRPVSVTVWEDDDRWAREGPA